MRRSLYRSRSVAEAEVSDAQFAPGAGCHCWLAQPCFSAFNFEVDYVGWYKPSSPKAGPSATPSHICRNRYGPQSVRGSPRITPYLLLGIEHHCWTSQQRHPAKRSNPYSSRNQISGSWNACPIDRGNWSVLTHSSSGGSVCRRPSALPTASRSRSHLKSTNDDNRYQPGPDRRSTHSLFQWADNGLLLRSNSIPPEMSPSLLDEPFPGLSGTVSSLCDRRPL